MHGEVGRECIRSESHLRCPSNASSRRRKMVCELDWRLTAFVSDTTMALVEDRALLRSSALDMENPGL